MSAGVLMCDVFERKQSFLEGEMKEYKQIANKLGR